MKNQITSRDYELLSAYLDNQLAAHERTRLETRLKLEPVLQREMNELGKTRSLLRSLPRIRAPRNYFVSAEAVVTAHATRPLFHLAPAYGIASAIATILLVLVIFGDKLLSSTSPVALAPASVAPTVVVEVVKEVELSAAPTSAPVEAAPMMMMEASEPITAPPPSANLKVAESGLVTPTTIYLDAMLPTSTPEALMSIMGEITITATVTCEEYHPAVGSQRFPLSSYCPTPTGSPSNFLQGTPAITLPITTTIETTSTAITATPTITPSPTSTPTPVPTEVYASLQDAAPGAGVEAPMMPAEAEQMMAESYPAPEPSEQAEKPGTPPNLDFIKYLVLAIELSLAAIAIIAGIIAIILRVRAGR